MWWEGRVDWGTFFPQAETEWESWWASRFHLRTLQRAGHLEAQPRLLKSWRILILSHTTSKTNRRFTARIQVENRNSPPTAKRQFKKFLSRHGSCEASQTPERFLLELQDPDAVSVGHEEVNGRRRPPGRGRGASRKWASNQFCFRITIEDKLSSPGQLFVAIISQEFSRVQ